jgi:hypothetical protein
VIVFLAEYTIWNILLLIVTAQKNSLENNQPCNWKSNAFLTAVLPKNTRGQSEIACPASSIMNISYHPVKNQIIPEALE